MLQVGIVGLPNVGKSTLFNLLTAAGVPAENYPFCTVDPNVGTVEVPDGRLKEIQKLAHARERLPTFIRFVDIAGLVKGASKGEGLGNQFLGQIREVDAIAHVLRFFEDPDVTHVDGVVDPVRDAGVVDTELALADLDTIERRREKVGKKARSGEKDARQEMEILDRLFHALESGRSLRHLDLSASEAAVVEGLHLLTGKPMMFIANMGEGWEAEEAGRSPSATMELAGPGRGREILVPLSLALEGELALLAPEEREEFLDALAMEASGADRVIRAAYQLLNLITFFTTNEKQTTAWAVPRGTRAAEAAGVVHTDFQKGFIRAEAIGFQEFARLGSLKEAREAGVVRSEGRDYVVEDGDILLFRFNL